MSDEFQVTSYGFKKSRGNLVLNWLTGKLGNWITNILYAKRCMLSAIPDTRYEILIYKGE